MGLRFEYFQTKSKSNCFEKFLSIFERLGIKRKNKIGFSCGKLFVINYFRGFEVLLFLLYFNMIDLTFNIPLQVIIMCAALLLRIIEMEIEK